METTVNSFLALDTKTKSWLEQNKGKVIKITMTDLKQDFYLVITPIKLLIYTIYSETPNTIIAGNALAFLKQLKKTIPEKQLVIEGDTELAQNFQLLLRNLNIEWEEYFSYFLGDITTNRLFHTLGQIKNSTTSFQQRTLNDLVEFIQEEKRFLPTKEEVEDFYEELAALRLNIDRLEARYMRLKET